MPFDQKKYQSIIDEFTIDTETLKEVAANFRQDMRIGLKDPDQSSMRMLKSYVGLPSGAERGEYLALDFGGTNVRVLRIQLQGNGRFEVLKRVGRPLVVPGEYDNIGPNSTADGMFGFIAELIEEALDGETEKKFLLGHTFSFPSFQTNLYNAKLITWTKEFATPGVEGQIVNDLLLDALKKRGVNNVEPVAVINDTVAVLLSAAYQRGSTFIGSIYATGHNTCYLEPYEDSDDEPMIINLECGRFSKLTPNRFDQEIDERSEKPGEQRLEKMVSGRYMGDLFSLSVAELLNESGKIYGFTSIDMSNIILDESISRENVKSIVQDKTFHELSTKDCERLQDIASAIVERSARLVTSTFVGIIWQLAGKGDIRRQHVAVDGSVYEKMPLAKDMIRTTLEELLGSDARNVDTVLDNGGSGLGAAIAAAMSQD